MSFTGSYTEDESGLRIQGSKNCKDFSRPNKEIKYFSRTLTEFRLFKTTSKFQDLFKIVRTVGNEHFMESTRILNFLKRFNFL